MKDQFRERAHQVIDKLFEIYELIELQEVLRAMSEEYLSSDNYVMMQRLDRLNHAELVFKLQDLFGFQPIPQP